MRGVTTFGDVSLDGLGIVVERVHDELSEMVIESWDGSGVDGSRLLGSRLPEREIVLECRAFCDTWEDFDILVSNLIAYMADGVERPLSVRTRSGEYYLAHFVGYDEGDREGGNGIGAFTLTFVASNPMRYAGDRSVSVSSENSATLLVGGNRPTRPRISAAEAEAGESGLWTLLFGDAVNLSVALESETHEVSIDCDRRVVTVDGATSMITLDSDWPVLSPGAHTVSMTSGTGDAVVSWTERNL